MISRRRFASVLSLGLAVPFVSACSSLFPGIQTGNTVADLTAVITVATNLSGWAADAWQFIPPLIQQAGLQAYTDAQNALKLVIQEAQDAVAAYQAGQGAAPNWAAIISSITQAADALVAFITSLMTSPVAAASKLAPTPQFTGRLTQLENAQKTLHRFKTP